MQNLEGIKTYLNKFVLAAQTEFHNRFLKGSRDQVIIAMDC